MTKYKKNDEKIERGYSLYTNRTSNNLESEIIFHNHSCGIITLDCNERVERFNIGAEKLLATSLSKVLLFQVLQNTEHYDICEQNSDILSSSSKIKIYCKDSKALINFSIFRYRDNDILQKSVLILEDNTVHENIDLLFAEFANNVNYVLRTPLNSAADIINGLSNKKREKIGESLVFLEHNIALLTKVVNSIILSNRHYHSFNKHKYHHYWESHWVIAQSILTAKNVTNSWFRYIKIRYNNNSANTLILGSWEIRYAFASIIENIAFHCQNADSLLYIVISMVKNQNSPTIRILFHNNGTKITKQDCKLFMQFFYNTAAPNNKGYNNTTNIGIATIERIIKSYGGSLTVKFPKKYEINIYVYLPLHAYNLNS